MGTLKEVFILHGWAYSTEKWQPLLSLLKKEGLVVKLLTIPGLTKKITRPWSIKDYVEWLNARIDGKAILIGHSNGGRIALNFALLHPQKVSQLFLIDSAGIYHNELPLRLKRVLFKGLAKTGKKLTPSQGLKKILYKLARTNDYNEANEEMKQTLINLTESDKSLDLQKITVPTTIIWGEKDTTTPLVDGNLINKKINNSKMYVIPEAKHSPQFTHPEKVTNVILNEVKDRSRM